MKEREILLANDEEGICEIVADRLQFYGYVVRTAASGEQCIEELKRNLPDLLLLDVRMPGLDGIDVLRYVQQHHISLPVLMLSATIERHVAEECLNLGAAGYIIKPFEPDELKEKVAQVLKNA